MKRATWHTTRNDRVSLVGKCARLFALALLLGAAVGTDFARAEDENLPEGAVIIDKYIEATGGKAAYEKLHTRVVKGTFGVPAMGMEAAMTVYSAEPNKYYVLIESDAMGKTEEGSNGDVAWSTAAMTGPRCKEGAERTDALREADFHGELNWRKHFKEAKCVGIEDVDGKPCYKVEMTPLEGKPRTRYYDQQSNLLVKMDMIAETPMGDLPVESFTTDYKKVDGVLIPHTTRQKVMGQEMVITLNSVEHNTDIPADKFKVPDDIQALVDKAKAEEAKPKPAKAEPTKAEPTKTE